MSKQVLSIEQMKHLHELGLDTSQASMEYIEDNNGKILCISKENEHNIKDIEEGFVICEALTLQDILDILPKIIEPDRCYLYIHFAKQLISFYGYEYANEGLFSYISFEFNDNCSIIDAVYEMLCWCIKNGYVGTCCS